MQAVRPVPQFLTEGNPPQNCSLQEVRPALQEGLPPQATGEPEGVSLRRQLANPKGLPNLGNFGRLVSFSFSVIITRPRNSSGTLNTATAV